MAALPDGHLEAAGTVRVYRWDRTDDFAEEGSLVRLGPTGFVEAAVPVSALAAAAGEGTERLNAVGVDSSLEDNVLAEVAAGPVDWAAAAEGGISVVLAEVDILEVVVDSRAVVVAVVADKHLVAHSYPVLLAHSHRFRIMNTLNLHLHSIQIRSQACSLQFPTSLRTAKTSDA